MSRGGVIPLVPRLPSEALRPDGLPLLDLYDRFFQFGLSAKSQSTQRNHARTRDLCRGMPEHPSPGDCAVWYDALRNAGLKESTIALHRWNLEAVYNYANATGWTRGNPVKLAPFTVPEPEPRAIPDIAKKWPRMLAVISSAGAVSGPRGRAFLGVLRFGALRVSEALGLLDSDVIPHRDGWTLNANKQRPAEKWEAVQPKTPKAKRALPVREPLRELLAPVLRMPAATVLVGRGGQEEIEVPFLFPYRPHDLEAAIAALRVEFPDDFGVNDAWHVFRHSCALEMANAQVPVTDLSRFLGHANIATTETYISALRGSSVGKGVIAGLDGPKRKNPRKVALKAASPPAAERRKGRSGQAPTLSKFHPK